jgi:hypothetical protein
MENAPSQPETTAQSQPRESYPTALGAATLLFIIGYAVASGRSRELARKGGSILTSIGLIAFDHISSSPLFEEKHKQVG